MRRRNTADAEAGNTSLSTPTACRIDRRWFTAAMSDQRISQRKLAKLMGVDPASIHRLLSGKRPMRMDEATQISRLLSVPVSDVLEHAGMNVKEGQRSVPLVGYVDGTGEAHLDWSARGPEVVAPDELPARTVAVQMRTATTSLDPWDGWTLFAELPKGVAPDALGRLCLVGLQGNGVQLLRFVRRGYARGRYNLMYPGTGDITDAALDWATPVLSIRP